MDAKGSDESFEAFQKGAEGEQLCEAFCQKHYAHAVPLVGGMEKMVKQVAGNPPGVLGTVYAERWHARGRVLLIGDSSHAMVPFFGQGCNCGFEDVLWLSSFLDEHCGSGTGTIDPAKCTGENFEKCFSAVERERKPNAQAICNMALENFVEMR